MVYIPITLTLKNESNDELLVEIPEGSIFEVSDPRVSVQNVSIIKELKIKLKPKQRVKLKGSGKCINPSRPVPHSIPGRLTVFVSS